MKARYAVALALRNEGIKFVFGMPGRDSVNGGSTYHEGRYVWVDLEEQPDFVKWAE